MSPRDERTRALELRLEGLASIRVLGDSSLNVLQVLARCIGGGGMFDEEDIFYWITKEQKGALSLQMPGSTIEECGSMTRFS